jgi:hypothetical protein
MGIDRTKEQLKELIIELIEERGTNKTICPSEAARKFRSDDWRTLMDTVREAARELNDDGRIEIFQNEEPVELEHVNGPVRLGLP